MDSQLQLNRTVDDLTHLYEQAWLIRAVEQCLLKLFSQGKLQGTVHTCIGQEWTGLAIAQSLTDEDVVFSNHRCHGHFIACTNNIDGLVAEVMGKASGVCGGRGGSQHLCHGRFFSNGVQGGIVPVSAGIAMAKKLRNLDEIAVVFIGDGTLGEGVVYEALNIAAKWQLPLLVVLENNMYSQSTPQHETLAGNICDRASAFGITSLRADTWNPLNLLDVAADAVKRVRYDAGPVLLQIDTYRLMAHSKGDDDRDQEEVQQYWRRDPLVRFAQENPEEAGRIEAAAEAQVDAAVARADADEIAEDDLSYCEQPGRVSWAPTQIVDHDLVVARIYSSLHRNMERDDRVLILGEDIEGPYGGAFKVTKDLSKRFPGRVRNTPISEAAIVGMGNGLALSGYVPICEIMFGDFVILAADQIVNHAAKFRYMYNDQVSVPLIIRTPMGGKRGYGATHSQSLEKHLLGLPGTRMLAIHHRFDPASVYDRLLTSIDRPTIVIENKVLYGQRVSHEAPDGYFWEHTDELFPTSRLRPDADPDLTILCYGGLLPDVEQAVDHLFDEHEIICEVICPTQIYPFNLQSVQASVSKTKRLLVVEEGQGFAAFGSEAVAQTAERLAGQLLMFRRVAAPPHAIPSCKALEVALLPGRDHVVAAAREMMIDG